MKKKEGEEDALKKEGEGGGQEGGREGVCGRPDAALCYHFGMRREKSPL